MPDLAPIVTCELTSQGWRGLTEEGEVLEVKGRDGPVKPAESIGVVDRATGEAIGFRAVPKPSPAGVIDDYLEHFTHAAALLRSNRPEAALIEIDTAIRTAATVRAKFNRSLILLSLGYWQEGLAQYAECERGPPFERANSRAARERGLRAWEGEEVAGKRLLLIHDHGLGDTIMTLRYVARLKSMGADVMLWVPPELERLAAQCAPVVDGLRDADYFCPMLLLMRLQHTPHDIPLASYLAVDPGLAGKWRKLIGDAPAVGVAWSVGKQSDGDYPRAAPLQTFVDHLGAGRLVSIQQQGAEEALALGVDAFYFEDFADCAALISVLDEVVSIDTAALHLAGAIGHPRVSGMLSHWHSWRWLSSLYGGVKLYRQQAPGDWGSAFDGLVRGSF